jgi:putative CocE/NonD family hydrolase
VQIERDVEMTTRDGVILRSDVYRPDDGGPFPTLLLRTPYGKTGQDTAPYYDFARVVGAGYIVVCQDARGRHASDGTWKSFINADTPDAADGYDAVEWAARLPRATGLVGTFGASYDSFLQWRTASAAPPSLRAMAAMSIPARYTDLEGPGTIRPGKRLHWWITKMAAETRRRSGAPGTKLRADGEAIWDAGEGAAWERFLPWSELPRSVFEDDTDAYQAWFRTPWVDPWQLDLAMPSVVVPNLDSTGWYDHAAGDFGTFQAITAHGGSAVAREHSRIVIGPWGHGNFVQSSFGPVDFGAVGLLDGVGLVIRWFDHWLKGVDNGVEREPRVWLYTMGDNRWRGEDAWPVAGTREQVLFTTSGGTANTAYGDGRLVVATPGPGEDRYVYDPRNPVPDLYAPGRISIPTDLRPLANRTDILVYQSEPLAERVEVTGYPVAEVTACSSAPDTDFFARLVDVAPDGLARDVATGMVRARYRDGVDRPSLIEPGVTVTYRIRLSGTSNAFLPGHRIRLDISSSCFPSYDRNHNTAADQNADATLRPADQTILHGGAAPTRLVLPVIDAR